MHYFQLYCHCLFHWWGKVSVTNRLISREKLLLKVYQSLDCSTSGRVGTLLPCPFLRMGINNISDVREQSFGVTSPFSIRSIYFSVLRQYLIKFLRCIDTRWAGTVHVMYVGMVYMSMIALINYGPWMSTFNRLYIHSHIWYFLILYMGYY